MLDLQELILDGINEMDACDPLAGLPIAHLSAATPTQPVFWYRPCSDGTHEGPIHDSRIEPIRKQSGAWVPLFAGKPPQPSGDGAAIIELAGHRFAAADLLRRAVRNIPEGRNGRAGVFWANVCSRFATGSTVSRALCEWAGVNPDTGEQLKEPAP